MRSNRRYRPGIGLVCLIAALSQTVQVRAQIQSGQILEGRLIDESTFLESLHKGDDFGSSVTPIGDVDGDGVGDIAVGAEDTGDFRGAVWVLCLKPDGTVRSYSKISAGLGGFQGELAEHDAFGAAVTGLGDLNGDGVVDLAVGAPLDDSGGPNFGAVWILFLERDGSVKGHTKISAGLGGFAGDLNSGGYFGDAVASVGDLDGDGVTDLAVGAWGDDGIGPASGAVWLLLLRPDGTVKAHRKIDPASGPLAGLVDAADKFGTSVASLGDLDGNGVGDLAVGAIGDDDGSGANPTDLGAVWILFMASNGTLASTRKISGLEGGFSGRIYNNDWFGSSLTALGDVDGDGVGDLAVGAIGDDDALTYGDKSGAVWVLFLAADGSVRSEQKINSFEGGFDERLAANFEFGSGVAALGDLDGDGVPDLTVGSPGAELFTRFGVVWTLFLDEEGTVRMAQKITDGEGGMPPGLANGDEFGYAVTRIGDLDGDGMADLAVGAPGDDAGGQDRGAVWTLRLRADGTAALHEKIGSVHGGFLGPLDDGDAFGSALATLGDLDGDGLPDLAVGAPGDDDGGQLGGDADVGAVWLLSSGAGGPAQSLSKISATEGGFAGLLRDGDGFGSSLAVLGGVDDDALVLAVGAPGDDDGALDAGAVWILFLDADGSLASERKISALEGGFTGLLEERDGFGSALAPLGDVDGDGNLDLAVGAPRDDDGGEDFGAAWVLLLNADGSVKEQRKISSTEGGFTGSLAGHVPGTKGDLFGSSLSRLGDLDGDGVADLAVGAIGDDYFIDDFYCPLTIHNLGAAWVLFLNADLTVKSHLKIYNELSGFCCSWQGSDLGQSVLPLGDLDGNGVIDLAVGMPGERTTNNAGGVWVLYMHVPTWADQGGGLAGTYGVPVISGEGALLGGQAVVFTLSTALENTPATLVVGASALHAPFAGGVMVPSPDLLLLGLSTDAQGQLYVYGPWPEGLPPGLTTYFQFWVEDPGGPQGYAATNAVSATTP